jgi:hypothetical protein
LLSIVLDQIEFSKGDYGRTINGIVYQEDKSTVFNLTGYTLNVRVLDDQYRQILPDIAGTITLAASGTFSFVMTDTIKWSTVGDNYIELELTQAGKVISTRPARVTVYESPVP